MIELLNILETILNIMILSIEILLSTQNSRKEGFSEQKDEYPNV